MAIYRRGGYWHYDFVVNGERRRSSTKIAATTAKPPASVKALVDRIRQQAILGEDAREVLTLEQAADKWFAARMADKKSAVTTAHRLEIAMRLYGAETLICDIDGPAVEAAIQARRLERTRQSTAKNPRFPSNATVNRDLIDSTLRPILKYARKYLKQTVHDIDWSDLKLREPKERVRSFSPDELKAFRAALPDWHQPVFDFISRYGVRMKEAFFAPSQFDGERITIKAKDRKNDREHVIPLLPEDRPEMAARVARARKEGLKTVWFKEIRSRVDGEFLRLEPIHWRAYQSASSTAVKRAKLTDARPVHDLRHHAATEALRRGGNLPAVKRLLGHDNIQSTMRYAHADEADVLAALGHVEKKRRR